MSLPLKLMKSLVPTNIAPLLFKKTASKDYLLLRKFNLLAAYIVDRLMQLLAKKTASVPFFGQRERYTRDSSVTAMRMARGGEFFQAAITAKASSRIGRGMGKVRLQELMAVNMTACSEMTSSTDKGSTRRLMAKFTLGNS